MEVLIIVSIAYLAGGFPTGVLVSRLVLGDDVRHFGSGNPGAINVWRVFGFRYGLLVVLVDMGKGFFAAGILPELFGHYSIGFAAFLGLMAVCGHVWSPWTRFRGGKGVGAAFGMAIAVYPQVALICTVVWVLALLITRYASISSLSAGACYPAALYWRHGVDWAEMAIGVTLSLLLAYTHRHNVHRLRCGEELKVWRNR